MAAPEPALVTKLKARKEVHRTRGPLVRGAFVAAGALLVLGGAAMLVLPGPAFVVIPIGLAVLALEFTWAERLLERSLGAAERARRGANDASPRQRLLAVLAVVTGIAAFVLAASLYDIPLLPVV